MATRWCLAGGDTSTMRNRFVLHIGPTATVRNAPSTLGRSTRSRAPPRERAGNTFPARPLPRTPGNHEAGTPARLRSGDDPLPSDVRAMSFRTSKSGHPQSNGANTKCRRTQTNSPAPRRARRITAIRLRRARRRRRTATPDIDESIQDRNGEKTFTRNTIDQHLDVAGPRDERIPHNRPEQSTTNRQLAVRFEFSRGHLPGRRQLHAGDGPMSADDPISLSRLGTFALQASVLRQARSGRTGLMVDVRRPESSTAEHIAPTHEGRQSNNRRRTSASPGILSVRTCHIERRPWMRCCEMPRHGRGPALAPKPIHPLWIDDSASRR